MLIFDDIEVEGLSTRYGRMLVPRKDSVIGRWLRIYGEWAEHEISMVSTLLRDGGVILDEGANIGRHALVLASRFPCSPVFAFQPQLLAANICLSSKPNCKPMPMACGRLATIGDVDPAYDNLDWNIGPVSLRDAFLGADQTSQRDNCAYPTLVVPPDVCRFPIKVQLIKIDVEGMEDDVIAGAVGLIERDRSAICLKS
jgi:FkbM family methyltransferase